VTIAGAFARRPRPRCSRGPEGADARPRTEPDRRRRLEAAEQTGLHPKHVDRSRVDVLRSARTASEHGDAVAFVAVAVIAAIGALVTALLVRRPPADVAGGSPLAEPP
jgi:hypothetical protein